MGLNSELFMHSREDYFGVYHSEDVNSSSRQYMHYLISYTRWWTPKNKKKDDFHTSTQFVICFVYVMVMMFQLIVQRCWWRHDWLGSYDARKWKAICYSLDIGDFHDRSSKNIFSLGYIKHQMFSEHWWAEAFNYVKYIIFSHKLNGIPTHFSIQL